MFKRFTSIALATFALASPIQANELKNYIYSNEVLAEVHNSGTTIRFKDESCSKPILGSYTRNSDVMVLCIANHNSIAQLADTIRHETIHIMQMCLGRPIMTFQQVANLAEPQDYEFMHNYHNITHHHELEANIAARDLNDSQVVHFYKEACYES